MPGAWAKLGRPCGVKSKVDLLDIKKAHCVVVPFFEDLLKTWDGIGSALTLMSVAIPVLLSMGIEAGKKGKSLRLALAWLPLVATLIGQFVGLCVARDMLLTYSEESPIRSCSLRRPCSRFSAVKMHHRRAPRTSG